MIICLNYNKGVPTYLIMDFQALSCKWGVLNQMEAKLVSCSSDETEFHVPLFVTNEDKKYIVTKIEDRAFEHSKVENLIFNPESQVSVMTLMLVASRITSVTLPKAMRFILDSALWVMFPNPCIKAHPNDEGKYFIPIQDGSVCRKYPFEVIQNYNNKKIVNVRESGTRIFPRAFYSNNAVTIISLPSSLKSIGPFAFSVCRELRRVNFAKDCQLTIIDENAFTHTKIEKIEFPKALKEIGPCAFDNCKNLKIVNFYQDSELEIIKFGAFSSSPIKCIRIPARVSVIENAAFSFCESLETVSFSKESNLISIGGSSFARTYSIKKIEFSENKVSVLKQSIRLKNLLKKLYNIT